MKIAIIGCGAVGQKRANTLFALGCSLFSCVDIDPDRARMLAQSFPGCLALTDWREAITHPAVDIVIIATIHSALAEICLAAVQSAKHVLIEKPAARFAHELDPIIKMAKETNSLVRVGFNHRYHPALQKARTLVDANALGDLMFLRARYGHGGRLGYEKEWRADPALSGGGELIDQGVHLIDLARWFLGDFDNIHGSAHTYFWDMPVDDNSFLLLKTPTQQTAFLHASCTEWKNLFSFELYGRTGKIDIDGLGGSYGMERLTYYKMLPEMGPPSAETWEYPEPDPSWKHELAEFLEDIRCQRQPSAGLNDAKAALQIVEKVYGMSNL